MQRFSIFLLTLFLVIAQVSFAEAKLPWVSKEEVPTLAPMLKKAVPAVVNISITTQAVEITNPLLNDPFFRHFFKDFGLPEAPESSPRQLQSIGSGVVIDANKGYIVTNHHVVKNADEIFVTFKDKRKLKVKLIGSDPDTDIALLKIEEKIDNVLALPLGDSDALEVGDFVAAIGNPFGLGHTVTSGIISALSRSGLGIEGYEDFIQTDASINPGNSGGALINLRGELIGINTAILSRSGGNMGIGFAIPINMARNIVAQLEEHGEIKRGQIGIHIQDVTPELAEALEMEEHQGALIAKVVTGSPADKAGIKQGDVVVEVNDRPIHGAAQLRNIVGLMRVGEEVTLTLLREGKSREATIKIARISEENQVAGREVELLQGARFATITPEHPLYNEVRGVVVVDIEGNSPAWQAGLRKGDVIVSVNQQNVNNVNELIKAAKERKKGILMNIRRGEAALFIVIN